MRCRSTFARHFRPIRPTSSSVRGRKRTKKKKDKSKHDESWEKEGDRWRLGVVGLFRKQPYLGELTLGLVFNYSSWFFFFRYSNLFLAKFQKIIIHSQLCKFELCIIKRKEIYIWLQFPRNDGTFSYLPIFISILYQLSLLSMSLFFFFFILLIFIQLVSKSIAVHVIFNNILFQLSLRSLDPSFGLLFHDLFVELDIDSMEASLIMSILDAIVNFSGM